MPHSETEEHPSTEIKDQIKITVCAVSFVAFVMSEVINDPFLSAVEI